MLKTKKKNLLAKCNSPAYGSSQLQEPEENNGPCPPSSSHPADLCVPYSILTARTGGGSGGGEVVGWGDCISEGSKRADMDGVEEVTWSDTSFLSY